MARGRRSKKKGKGGIITVIIAGGAVVFSAVANFVSENSGVLMVLLLIIGVAFSAYAVIKRVKRKQREELLTEILEFLNFTYIDDLLRPYDDQVIVKSRQALDNYDDIKYLKESDRFEDVKRVTRLKAIVKTSIISFLKENEFSQRPQYAYVANQLNHYASLLDGYRVSIIYITSAGNNKGERLIRFTESRVEELEAHPEYLMTKGEYNKILKQQERDELEEKKRLFYNKVNSIIDLANESKDCLIVKTRVKKLD